MMADQQLVASDDDDDWQDLEKPAKGEDLPEVSFRIAPFAGRHGVSGKVRATAVFRRAAAEWLRAKGPRFRIQIGGANANKVRLIVDAAGGQYEPIEFRGSFRLSLGSVNVWPKECRDATPAK